VKRAPRLLGLLLSFSGCGTSATASKSASAPVASVVQSRVLLCAETRLSARGQVCVRPLRDDEQRHRSVSVRLELESGLPVRLRRVNGRGFPEADDDGCVEYRYRFEAGFIVESTGYRRDGTVCDRSLFAEGASQASFVDQWGRPDFARDRLHTKMLRSFDADGMVVAQRPLASDGTPTTLQGASELRYERDALKLEKSVCYFDAQGKPMADAAGIHCWRSERDQVGNELRRSAWDERGNPAVSVEGVHAFVKEYDRYGNLMMQTAVDAGKKLVTLDTARCPKLAYRRDGFGFLLGTDCLDGTGKSASFSEGNALWRATPDARGLPREYRYFDQRGDAIAPTFGYWRLELERDAAGHILERRFFAADAGPGQKKGAPITRSTWNPQHLEVARHNLSERGTPWLHRGCASTSHEYDQFRQLVRSTCLGQDGKPALSWDNVCATVSRYDARGLLVESRYLDVAGKPIDSDDGYQRIVYSHDARGVDSKARHFKADGSELTLRRFATLWVRPPLADGLWPAPSRALAVQTIEQARRELVAGMSWEKALLRYGDEKVYPVNPGDTGYSNVSTLFPAIRAALARLEVGEYSRIVEIPYGFAIYLRTE
jgi:hypothetical protein